MNIISHQLLRNILLILLPLISTLSFAQDRGRLANIDANSSFLIYYGNDFSQRNVDLMKTFDVVVLDANLPNCTPRIIQELQDAGVKYVLGYISIGEDLPKTYTENNIEITESPIIGDSLGPIYVDETTREIVLQNQGVASFYVDSVLRSIPGEVSYEHDGMPDSNPMFHGYYVYPNDDWRWVLNVMRIGGAPGVFMQRKATAGLQQIAGDRALNIDSRTENFGFDGFFLDTLDTAGPYTNLGWYPWAAGEMTKTVAFISNTYPNKAVFANRGLFYYQPGLYNATYDVRPIEHSIRPHINAALFESYKLDSDETHLGNSPYYLDNKYNTAPKMMAESNRVDGFTVFGADYMAGRDSALYEALYQETTIENGWTQFLSLTGALATIETFIRDHPQVEDLSEPEWISTASQWINDAEVTEEELLQLPSRIGIQKLSQGANSGEIVINWDAAKDHSWPVKYNIYIASQPDFSDQVKYAAVPFQKGLSWDIDPMQNYANEITLNGFPAGTYYVRVRAEDSSPAQNEDTNTHSLSITLNDNIYSNPVLTGDIILDGDLNEWAGLTSFGVDPDDVPGVDNQVDWRQVWMAHDTNNLYLAYQNDTAISINWGYTAYLDTDTNKETGFTGGDNSFPIGSEFMIQGFNLYRYTGSGIDWQWEFTSSLGRVWNGPYGEMYIPISWLGNPREIQLFFHGNNAVYNRSEIDLYPNDAISSKEYFSYLLE